MSTEQVTAKATPSKSSWKRCFNSSEENLLKECGNHLFLGQWELFRGAIHTLSNRTVDKRNILRLIQSVYNCPHLYSHGSNKISTPCDLFWLCAKLHQEVNGNEAQDDALLRDAAFRFLLCRALPITTEEFVKELYALYRFVASNEHRTIDSILSSECRRSIRGLVKASPDLGVSVLEALIVTERRTQAENSLALLRLLYDGLDYEISLLETTRGSWSAISSSEGDRDSGGFDPKAFRLLLRIADALFAPQIAREEAPERIECYRRDVRQLVQRLWSVCERDATYKHIILDCMLCQPNLTLLRTFYEVDDILRNRIERADGGRGNVTSTPERFLRLVYDQHGKMDVKEAFLFSVVNKCHFLDMLVSSCIDLISSGEHLLARSVLCSQAFCKLKGMAFLLSWSKVKCSSDAVRLVEAFDSMRDDANDGDIQLIESCNKLVAAAKLVLRSLESRSVRRCLNNQRNIVAVLSTLQDRSALNILHSCHHMNQLEREVAYGEVARITEGDRAACSRSLLTGFYLLYDLFNVVSASTKVNLLIADYRNRQRKLSRDSQTANRGTCVNFDEIRVYYEDNVTEPLKRIRDRIGDLSPLCFRIEVLENAFSLLFLTHRDTKAGSRGCSSSSNTDGEEENNGEEKADPRRECEKPDDETIPLCRSPESDTASDDDHVRHGSSGRGKKSRLRSASRDMSRQYPLGSENAGSLSAGSSASSRLSRVGFLLNEYVVRDVLDCLRRCVVATTFFADVNSGVDSGEKCSSLLPCSVPEKQAPQRAARLSQYISEAIWRQQLATDDCTYKEVGVLPFEDISFDLQAKTDVTWSFYNFQEEEEDSEEGVENEKGLRCAPRHSVPLRTPFTYGNESSAIIPKMLAQHDTLLNNCLQQNDLVKAGQVIKMFGLESSERTVELEFATHYEESVRRLSRTPVSLAHQEHGTRKANSPLSALSEQRRSAWNSIVEAAQAGADAAETMIADELLASHKIPRLPDVNESAVMSQWIPNPIDWRALVRADLAVVACRRIPACRNLLEAAHSTLSRGVCQVQNRSVPRSKSATPTRGIVGFLENVTLLVSSDTTSRESRPPRRGSWSKSAARDLLLSGLSPLSSKANKNAPETWLHLASVLDRLRHSIRFESSDCREHDDGAASTSKPSRPSRHPIHAEFRKLQKISAAMRSFLDEDGYVSLRPTNLGSECTPTPAYLATLYDYAKRLFSILPQFPQQFATTQVGSYFSVFHQSPLAILERLLFDDSISPSELESFAKQLGVDMVQVIVKRCFPPIPATSSDSEPKWQPRKLSIHHLEFIKNRCHLAAVLIQALGCAETAATDGEAVEYAVVLYPVLHRFLDYRGAGADSRRAAHVLSSCTSLDSFRTTFETMQSQENWNRALEYLDSWECRSPLVWDAVGPLRDSVVSHLVTDQRTGHPRPWLLASRIRDITLRSKLVLEQFWNWSAVGALYAFDICLSHPDLEQSTRTELKCHLHRIELYDTICNKILKGDIAWTAEFFNCTWQVVSKLSVSAPSALLAQLFDAECYDLILAWSRLHPVPEVLSPVIDESYLLDASSSSPATIRKVLERITDPERRVFICERLLNSTRRLHSDSTVVQLMMGMENFTGHCDNEVTHHRIGAKILLCFSEEERVEYLGLVSHPHFLIEQMLIDIKIKPLERAFQLIRDDLKAFDESSCLSFSSFNTLLEIYAFKAVDFRVAQTLSSDYLEATAPDGMGSPTEKKLPFVVPMAVPSKQQWVPDATVANCMVCCAERFSMFNRRHHCRRCGRVVCGNCSQQSVHVDGYGDVEVRVCDDCYDQAKGFSAAGQMHHLENRLKARLAGTSTDEGKTALKREPSSESEHSRRSLWKLSTDETHNHTAREEFSYEQAPNISLCLSILDLHWDQHRSGLYILELADNMFRLLQPVEPGKPNPEIDYNLVINMLKSVLLSAKVKFSRSCDSDGVNRCDLYLSLANLLKLLVVANCKDLIPVGDLTQNDVVRRLRDRLILNERWTLALDISTKGGLEVIGVWSAWGTACLRVGRYAVAREKFSLCFQRLKDQNKVTQTNALLHQILDQLGSSKNVPIEDRSAVSTTSLQRLRNIRQGIVKDRSANLESANVDSFIRNECLFYIETFGTGATYLSFYVRHNLWEDALRHTLENKCTAAAFIDEVAMPSLRRGRFPQLLNQMNWSFDKWTPYLGPLCRHLERYDYIHSLYGLQVFMKDHVRAAMTCIVFFRRGTRDYSELYDRLPHLARAKQHLEQYTLQAKCGTFGTTTHTLGMSMPAVEVHRYLRSIAMQVEVTHFLHDRPSFGRSHRSTSMASESPGASGTSPCRATISRGPTETGVPTVFDDSKARAHLAAAVILAGDTIGEGFSLANRIVREFKLHVGNVYGLVARKLVRSERIEDLPLLVSCLMQSGRGIATDTCDEVVSKAIEAVLAKGADSSDVDYLVRLLKKDTNKIDAFIRCGKLKSAYLLAVKVDSVATVMRIKGEAERINQPSVKALCIKWLNIKAK